MVDFFLAVFFKPFIVFVLFLLVYLIAQLFWKVLPDGRIKRILFSPLPGHEARSWWPTDGRPK